MVFDAATGIAIAEIRLLVDRDGISVPSARLTSLLRCLAVPQVRAAALPAFAAQHLARLGDDARLPVIAQKRQL